MAKTAKASAKKATAKVAKPVAKATAKTAVKAKAPVKTAKPLKAVKVAPKTPVKKIEVKPAPKVLAPVKVAEIKETKASKADPKPVKTEKVKAPEGASEDLKKWYDYKNKHGAEKALPYSMSSVFEPNKPIDHKVMGWGWIVNIQNDRLEVLFEQGIKYLISNYKPR